MYIYSSYRLSKSVSIWIYVSLSQRQFSNKRRDRQTPTDRLGRLSSFAHRPKLAKKILKYWQKLVKSLKLKWFPFLMPMISFTSRNYPATSQSVTILLHHLDLLHTLDFLKLDPGKMFTGWECLLSNGEMLSIPFQSEDFISHYCVNISWNARRVYRQGWTTKHPTNPALRSHTGTVQPFHARCSRYDHRGLPGFHGGRDLGDIVSRTTWTTSCLRKQPRWCIHVSGCWPQTCP